MRAIIVLCTSILLSNLTYSQITDSLKVTSIRKSDYLATAKLQKTLGWTIFGTGIPVVLFTGYFLITGNKNDIDKSTVAKVFVASTTYTLVSIPLIVAGKRNKKRALSLNVSQYKISLPGLNSFETKIQTAVCLTIPLKM